MTWTDFGARDGLRYCFLAIVALAAIFAISSDVADARRHHERRADGDDVDLVALDGEVDELVYAGPADRDVDGRPLRTLDALDDFLGLPPRIYSRVQPYVAPTLSHDGGATAGLTFRF